MSLSNLASHGQKALKEANSGNSNSGNFQKDNIWFDWGDKEEHVIRLVGDFKWIRSHWIGESQYGKDIALLNAKAFKGEGKIPMNVACGNWDPETESEKLFIKEVLSEQNVRPLITHDIRNTVIFCVEHTF